MKVWLMNQIKFIRKLLKDRARKLERRKHMMYTGKHKFNTTCPLCDDLFLITGASGICGNSKCRAYYDKRERSINSINDVKNLSRLSHQDYCDKLDEYLRYINEIKDDCVYHNVVKLLQSNLTIPNSEEEFNIVMLEIEDVIAQYDNGILQMGCNWDDYNKKIEVVHALEILGYRTTTLCNICGYKMLSTGECSNIYCPDVPDEFCLSKY